MAQSRDKPFVNFLFSFMIPILSNKYILFWLKLANIIIYFEPFKWIYYYVPIEISNANLFPSSSNRLILLYFG